MSRIKLKDLPLDKKIRKEDMKNIRGGILTTTTSLAPVSGTSTTSQDYCAPSQDRNQTMNDLIIKQLELIRNERPPV